MMRKTASLLNHEEYIPLLHIESETRIMTEVIVNGKELKAKDSLKTSDPKVIQLRFKKALYSKRDLEAAFKQSFDTISIDTFDMDYTQLEGILEDKRNELYVVVLRQP